MTNSSKEQLRKIAIARRDALPLDLRIEASLALVDHWVGDVMGKVIAGYHPIRSEIDPRPLMMHLKRLGARLALPVPQEPHMIFRELTHENALVSAGFGTLAPPPENQELTPDILLMPLAAFDKTGNRIGYGKGHYDKYLSQHSPLKIGIAYAIQEFDKIEPEVHDKRLDYILTERGLMKAPS
jgi:5-formyltetrahydrofolate cyclo-ligase